MDAIELDYHKGQIGTVYRSSVKFAEFIAPFVHDTKTIVDLGCGAGGATAYLKTIYPKIDFTGVDHDQELIELAMRANPYVKFMRGDMFNLYQSVEPVDGVISLATLSWLPSFRRPLDEICHKINPRWMAFSSLFYDGDISAHTMVREHKRNRETFYNVYSIPQVREFMTERGYSLVRYERFDIDVYLPRPDDPDVMKTWTKRVSEGWMQISGPLMLPWGFVSFSRDVT